MIVPLLQAVPVVVTAPPPPSPPFVVQAPRILQEPRVSYPVDAEIRSGTAVIWRGSLRLATGGAATFRQSMSQAPETTCEPASGYMAPLETGLTLLLLPERFGAEADRLRVTVRWTRAGAERCPVYGATRTVELNDVVRLAPGTSVTLTGDGDLSVRLTRR